MQPQQLKDVDAMDSTGTYQVANEYTYMLKKASMTTKVNSLRKMCLLPFLKDILSKEGNLRKYVSDKDKKIWNKFLSCCFPELSFEQICSMPSNLIYIGNGNESPLNVNIPERSVAYSTDDTSSLISEMVHGRYFWVALPYGLSLMKIEAVNDGGLPDTLDLSLFSRVDTTINNGQYNLFFVKARIPLQRIYKITVK